MPNLGSHLDTVGGARYIITVCDIQNAHHQIPAAASEQDKTAFVTQNGKWVFKPAVRYCKRALTFLAHSVTSSRTFWSEEWSLGVYGRLYMLFILFGRPPLTTGKHVQSITSSRPLSEPIKSTASWTPRKQISGIHHTY